MRSTEQSEGIMVGAFAPNIILSQNAAEVQLTPVFILLIRLLSLIHNICSAITICQTKPSSPVFMIIYDECFYIYDRYRH